MADNEMTLEVIPKPLENTRSVIEFENIGNRITGESADGVTLICGECGSILVEKLNRNQIRNIVIRCPSCKSYNNVP